MHRTIAALSIMLLLSLGCVSQPQAQNATAPSGPASQNASPAPQANPPSWAHYSNLGMSFDYPAGMRVNESLDLYPRSATVVVQSSDAAEGALIVQFVNASLAANLSSRAPQDIAAIVLGYDNSSGSDALLVQADGTGEMANYTTPEGLGVAEMRFTLPSGNDTFYGYAIEIFDPKALASYPIRIISSSPNQTQAMKDKFMQSFRSG